MRKVFFLLLTAITASCVQQAKNDPGERIITVSIAPLKYFVEAIAGKDFTVNVMVPPGSDPHIYEPVPEQIKKLERSEAYISNGYLGFEMAWLDRFYELNRNMKHLSLGDSIDPIANDHSHDGDHMEHADPHYWVSPKCAASMASSVLKFLTGLNPEGADKYVGNYNKFMSEIDSLDRRAGELFIKSGHKSFMIYHPNLAYLARDYGLVEIAVEFEGKEPTPARMKELIDLANSEHIRTIFVQREYDTRNARAIARETGADLTIIDPLSGNWLESTGNIIEKLGNSLK